MARIRMKRRVHLSQIRGKRILNVLYDIKLETLLMTFTDNSYALISVDGASNPQFVRTDFNKHLIDIVLPAHLVKVKVEEVKKKDPYYGMYLDSHPYMD